MITGIYNHITLLKLHYIEETLLHRYFIVCTGKVDFKAQKSTLLYMAAVG